MDVTDAPDQLPEEMDVSALIEMAGRLHEDAGGARLALKTLARVDHGLAIGAALRAVAAAREEDLRATAAILLGQTADAEARHALIAALDDDRPVVRRRVIESLGKVGDEETLDRLERLEADPGSPVGAALAFARVLLSYRLGLDRHLVDLASGDLSSRPPAGRLADLELRPAEPEVLDDASRQLGRDLPGREFDRGTARMFRCGTRDHLLLVDAEIAKHDLRERMRRPAVIGVIARYRPCPDRYSLDTYLLTDAGNDGERVRLGAVRSTGTIVYAGGMTFDDRRALFSIDTANPPYSRNLRITGVLDPASNDLRFERAVVALSLEEGDRRPKAPQLVTR